MRGAIVDERGLVRGAAGVVPAEQRRGGGAQPALRLLRPRRRPPPRRPRHRHHRPHPTIQRLIAARQADADWDRLIDADADEDDDAASDSSDDTDSSNDDRSDSEDDESFRKEDEDSFPLRSYHWPPPPDPPPTPPHVADPPAEGTSAAIDVHPSTHPDAPITPSSLPPLSTGAPPASALTFTSALFPSFHGSALYPVLACLNHSCVPTAEVVFMEDARPVLVSKEQRLGEVRR